MYINRRIYLYTFPGYDSGYRSGYRRFNPFFVYSQFIMFTQKVIWIMSTDRTIFSRLC